MKAVTRAGLRVPEDIAIIGFDDSSISRVVEPELTTVRIDAAKMGCLAMQTLFDLIAGMPVEKAHIQIPTELKILTPGHFLHPAVQYTHSLTERGLRLRNRH